MEENIRPTVDSLYADLNDVLLMAFSQAAKGKGAERHARVGESFKDQPICTITRQLGIAFPLGQAVKKIYETGHLFNEQDKIAELLGAINYLAAAVIVLREPPAEDAFDISEVQS